VFLLEPDHRVENDNRADRDGIEWFSESCGHDTCDEQEPDDGAGKLAGDKRQRAGCLLATNLVRTELSEATLSVGRRKTGCKVWSRGIARVWRQRG
jgi:hypothetical protein